MTTIKEWYKQVNDAWPEDVPQLEFEEGVRAIRKLYRFVTGNACEWAFKETSGNRHNWYKHGAWQLNTAPAPHHLAAHGSAWGNLIHDFSHYAIRYVYDYRPKPHSKEHAKFELKLVKECVKRGWHLGVLKDEPEPAVSVPPEQAKVADALKKQERLAAAIARWNTKRKRAETALKKLQRKHKYYAAKLDSFTV